MLLAAAPAHNVGRTASRMIGDSEIDAEARTPQILRIDQDRKSQILMLSVSLLEGDSSVAELK
jgi:hypothetical protein